MKQTWLQRVAASLVSRPAIYDLVQRAAGQPRLAEHVSRAVSLLGPLGRLLDVGTAEGGFAARLGLDAVLIDLDPRPLAALRRKRPSARAAAADATLMPFGPDAFDVTFCLLVSHHLDDEQLRGVVSELARVTSRKLVFLDAVRNEERALSRWMWRFDRGRHPRTAREIGDALAEGFLPDAPEAFTVRHQYSIWVLSPRPRVPAR